MTAPAEHDAYLRAGLLTCPDCRRDAYPTDATWLAVDLLIATYAPICQHHPEPRTIAVTPSQLDPFTGRCHARTTAGDWCRAHPMRGRKHCRAHDRSRTGRTP